MSVCPLAEAIDSGLVPSLGCGKFTLSAAAVSSVSVDVSVDVLDSFSNSLASLA